MQRGAVTRGFVREARSKRVDGVAAAPSDSTFPHVRSKIGVRPCEMRREAPGKTPRQMAALNSVSRRDSESAFNRSFEYSEQTFICIQHKGRAERNHLISASMAEGQTVYDRKIIFAHMIHYHPANIIIFSAARKLTQKNCTDRRQYFGQLEVIHHPVEPVEGFSAVFDQQQRTGHVRHIRCSHQVGEAAQVSPQDTAFGGAWPEDLSRLQCPFI